VPGTRGPITPTHCRATRGDRLWRAACSPHAPSSPPHARPPRPHRPAIPTPYEHPRDWQRFHDSVVESLHPEPGIAAHPAGRFAELMWRLRRVSFAEAQFA